MLEECLKGEPHLLTRLVPLAEELRIPQRALKAFWLWYHDMSAAEIGIRIPSDKYHRPKIGSAAVHELINKTLRRLRWRRRLFKDENWYTVGSVLNLLSKCAQLTESNIQSRATFLERHPVVAEIQSVTEDPPDLAFEDEDLHWIIRWLPQPNWKSPSWGPGIDGPGEFWCKLQVQMEKYPSIVQLPDCPEIFSVKQVIATEKLHGSNFRLFFPLGMKSIDEIGYGSRDVEYQPGQDFPLGSTLNKFKSQTNLLTRMMEVVKSYGFSDVTVFGEAYGPGIKAKGVRYSTGQEPLFRAFDIMIAQNFVTYDLFVELCNQMGLPMVPEVWRGEPTQANFDALLEQPSVVGKLNGFGDDNIAEGVVIRSNPLLRNVFGEWLICKHKSAKFAEVAKEAVQKIPRGPTAADDFAAKYVTEGRVTNAIGRLHDSGNPLTNSMKDMPVLLGAVCADLVKDCSTEMAELGITEQSVKGNVSRVLGPMYREMLTRE